MFPTDHSETPAVVVNPFTAEDVLRILRQRGWLLAEATPEQNAWCERAASMLGPHAPAPAAFAELLQLIFHYDAGELMARVENHAILSRYAARDVIRQFGLALLDGAPLTSERFKEIITDLKDRMELRGRELFHPIRLALAGLAGEGELDRVILLLDEAAALAFAVPVKSARMRILEFCSVLD